VIGKIHKLILFRGRGADRLDQDNNQVSRDKCQTTCLISALKLIFDPKKIPPSGLLPARSPALSGSFYPASARRLGCSALPPFTDP
jgi:hypothetical protein